MSDLINLILSEFEGSGIRLPKIDPDDLVVPETPIYGTLVDYKTNVKIRNATKYDYKQFIKSTGMCQLYWYPSDMGGVAVSIVVKR